MNHILWHQSSDGGIQWDERQLRKSSRNCCQLGRMASKTSNETIIRVTGEHRTVPVRAPSIGLTKYPTVGSASGIAKWYLYSFPDPFAVLSVDDDQIHTMKTIKKTLTHHGMRLTHKVQFYLGFCEVDMGCHPRER